MDTWFYTHLKGKVPEVVPGLFLVVIVVALGYGLSAILPGLGRVTSAIVVGIILGNTAGVTPLLKRGVRLCEKRLLNIAIALMGLELELQAAAGLGMRTVPLIVGVIAASIFIGLVFGRFLRLPGALALLLGIGNGICGSAAIAASAPLIGAKKDEIGISIGVVNLMGAIGIFLIPALALGLGLDIPESGLLIGGTLQAVGQTVATGLRMGEEVARLATVVKMGRVLMLGVVLLVLSFGYSRGAKREENGEDRAAGGARPAEKPAARRFPVPPFIVAFVTLALAVNLFPLPDLLLDVAGRLQDLLLLAAVAAIGLGIELRSILRYGAAAFLLSAVIFSANILLVLSLR